MNSRLRETTAGEKVVTVPVQGSVAKAPGACRKDGQAQFSTQVESERRGFMAHAGDGTGDSC